MGQNALPTLFFARGCDGAAGTGLALDASCLLLTYQGTDARGRRLPPRMEGERLAGVARGAGVSLLPSGAQGDHDEPGCFSGSSVLAGPQLCSLSTEPRTRGS